MKFAVFENVTLLPLLGKKIYITSHLSDGEELTFLLFFLYSFGKCIYLYI